MRGPVEVGELRVVQGERVEHRRVPDEAQALGRLLGGEVACLHLGDESGEVGRLENLAQAPELRQSVQRGALGHEDAQTCFELLGPELFELSLAKRALEVAQLGGELPERALRQLEALGETGKAAVE